MSAQGVSAPTWLQKLEVRYRPVAELVASPRNARTHSEQQVAQIAASIREFGWTNPVLIDEANEIIAGHGRVRAAQLLELEQVPCLELHGLTEYQKRGYALADNKLALNAGWNVTLLAEELAALSDVVGFDMALVGFSDAELSHLMADDSAPPDQGTEWNGMPEFTQEDKTAFRSIIMHFRDQDAVDAFAKLIEQEVSAKARYLWFPVIEKETYMDKRYVTDES